MLKFRIASTVTLAALPILWQPSLAAPISKIQNPSSKIAADWPSFRGPNACGIAEGYPTPTTWNADESDGRKAANILWKTPIPGLGHSSPIVWGDRLFVTTAISGKEKPEFKVGLYGSGTPAEDDTVHAWKVYCLDKKTGKVLWEQTAHRGVPKVKRHPKATQANCTMATDGKRVVAFFGSEGLYCYDMRGKLLWKKDLGVLQSSPTIYNNAPYTGPVLEWGFASSPIIHENRVLVQCDVRENSFLAAFDLRDGREVWRTPRDDTATWCTPTVYVEGGGAQLLVNGWKHMGGYDARTGKEIWRLEPIPIGRYVGK